MKNQNEPEVYAVGVHSLLRIIRNIAKRLPFWILAFLLFGWYHDWDLRSPIEWRWFMGSFALGEVLPCLIFFIHYFAWNGKTMFLINTQEQNFLVHQEGRDLSFGFKDVARLILSLQGSIFGEGRSLDVPWVIFNYAFIETRTGEQIIITSLLVDDLQSLFNRLGINFTKEIRSYSWIILSRYNKKPSSEW